MPPIAAELRKLDAASTLYATQFVDLALTAALEASEWALRVTGGKAIAGGEILEQRLGAQHLANMLCIGLPIGGHA